MSNEFKISQEILDKYGKELNEQVGVMLGLANGLERHIQGTSLVMFASILNMSDTPGEKRSPEEWLSELQERFTVFAFEFIKAELKTMQGISSEKAAEAAARIVKSTAPALWAMCQVVISGGWYIGVTSTDDDIPEDMKKMIAEAKEVSS